MKSVFPFAPATVKFISNGFGKCHVCSNGGSGDVTAVLLSLLKKEHPEWFKTAEERSAGDGGHWIRFNFKNEFQAVAEERCNEILLEEVLKPVVQLAIDDKPILFCAECLRRYADDLEVAVQAEEQATETEGGPRPVKRKPEPPKRGPGRPKFAKQEAAAE